MSTLTLEAAKTEELSDKVTINSQSELSHEISSIMTAISNGDHLLDEKDIDVDPKKRQSDIIVTRVADQSREILQPVATQHLTVTKSNTRYKRNLTDSNPCPNCHSTNVKLQGGCYVCSNCFSLLESTFDEGGEWKNYQNDSTTSANPRCSLQINPYLPETSAHTFMKTSNTGDRYSQRFHQLSSWMVPHHEKSLNSRLHDIAYFGSLCNLPGNVIDFTKQIYVEFIELQPIYKKKKSSRGDCHSAILAVIILIACKEYGIRRSPDDICDGISINTSDFTKAANLVFSVLQHSHLLDIAHHQYIVNSGDYIDSFCRIMGITGSEILEQISRIEKKVNELKILTKNTPQAIACGCIYFVTKMHNIKINRHDFDTKCNVSLPTLNKVYENLIEYTDSLID